ncbi:MAG TPA: hypothetical protein VFB99_03215 [Vicinamibacterales bacterium]|nr:hypothetical protein [Vicinamibacterales bacterium]HZM37087.1 hypothetical protein [Burkholderiales bacterium]
MSILTNPRPEDRPRIARLAILLAAAGSVRTCEFAAKRMLQGYRLKLDEQEIRDQQMAMAAEVAAELHDLLRRGRK